MGALNVGAVGIDAIRNITAWVCPQTYNGTAAMNMAKNISGAFYPSSDNVNNLVNASGGPVGNGSLYFDASRVVPTGASNAPRRFGVLACSYMGQPAL